MTFEKSESLNGVAAVNAFYRPHARVPDGFDVHYSRDVFGVARAIHLVETGVSIM